MPVALRSRNVVAWAALALAAGLTAPGALRAQDAQDALTELPRASRSFEDLATRVLPSVVQIFVMGEVPVGNAAGTGALLRPVQSVGSGVVISDDGLILTNAHVVQNAREVQVLHSVSTSTASSEMRSLLRPKGTRTGAQIVGLDEETDLALLRADLPGTPPLEFADSDGVRPGQLVFAFGSPQGLTNSVSMGVISSVARQPAPEHPMVYLQTDATISPGSSGGPLVDTDGRVVGINTWILSNSGGSEGLGFAVPSNIAKAIAEQIRAQGRVTRGDIGVHAQTITPWLATGLGLDRTWGVILGDVLPGGPAERAGLRGGDLVLSLNGKPMENGRQLDVNIYQFRPGSKVTIEIERDGQSRLFDVEVRKRDDERARLAEFVTRERNLLSELGVLAIALTPEVRELLPPLRDRTGLLVVAQAGTVSLEGDTLLAGDVIHQIDNRDVTSLAEARQALSGRPVGSLTALQVERDRVLRYLVAKRR